MTAPIHFPPPRLQLGFALTLQHLREVVLQPALLSTVSTLAIEDLDRQLAAFVPAADLATLARFGLRAELLFAVPLVLTANPRLLGYYRLLLGYSQKEFYGRDKGFQVSKFQAMEAQGKLNPAVAPALPALCAACCEAASALLAGLTPLPVTSALLDDLTLLTVGPQLRGGANNQRGTDGIAEVFDLLRELVAHAASTIEPRCMVVTSATGRPFLIEFAADPDIIIREAMDSQHYRNVVAIEVKSGTDASNIHNRIGEAEKSHQKARQRGFTECWTVVNVPTLDMAKARSESPSTDRFYSLAALSDRAGFEYADFRRRVLSLTAIPAPPPL